MNHNLRASISRRGIIRKPNIEKLSALVSVIISILSNLRSTWDVHIQQYGQTKCLKFIDEENWARLKREKRIQAHQKRSSQKMFAIKTKFNDIRKQIYSTTNITNLTVQNKIVDRLYSLSQRVRDETLSMCKHCEDVHMNIRPPQLYDNLSMAMKRIIDLVDKAVPDMNRYPEYKEFEMLKVQTKDFIHRNMTTKFSCNNITQHGYIDRLPSQFDLDDLQYGVALPSSNKLENQDKFHPFNTINTDTNLSQKKKKSIPYFVGELPNYTKPTTSFKIKKERDQVTDYNWDGNTYCANKEPNNKIISNRLGVGLKSVILKNTTCKNTNHGINNSQNRHYIQSRDDLTGELSDDDTFAGFASRISENQDHSYSMLQQSVTYTVDAFDHNESPPPVNNIILNGDKLASEVNIDLPGEGQNLQTDQDLQLQVLPPKPKTKRKARRKWITNFSQIDKEDSCDEAVKLSPLIDSAVLNQSLDREKRSGKLVNDERPLDLKSSEKGTPEANISRLINAVHISAETKVEDSKGVGVLTSHAKVGSQQTINQENMWL